jgi:hypothetical protein
MNVVISISSLADTEPAQAGSKAFSSGVIFCKGMLGIWRLLRLVMKGFEFILYRKDAGCIMLGR